VWFSYNRLAEMRLKLSKVFFRVRELSLITSLVIILLDGKAL